MLARRWQLFIRDYSICCSFTAFVLFDVFSLIQENIVLSVLIVDSKSRMSLCWKWLCYTDSESQELTQLHYGPR